MVSLSSRGQAKNARKKTVAATASTNWLMTNRTPCISCRLMAAASAFQSEKLSTPAIHTATAMHGIAGCRPGDKLSAWRDFLFTSDVFNHFKIVTGNSAVAQRLSKYTHFTYADFAQDLSAYANRFVNVRAGGGVL